MAFDYGSIDLGLKNPFKKEGIVNSVRGGIQFFIGLYLMLDAVTIVKDDAIAGWIIVAFAVGLLAGGISALSRGIYSMLKYFVGRNHPTSLAKNHSQSEGSNADHEADYVAYTGDTIEEMLVGRKNTTFVEPDGFLARLLHTFFPKLLFMPYPIRNMTQRIFGAWVKTLTAVLAFALVAFVSLAGFVGETGKVLLPIYSLLLLVYLFSIWQSMGRVISRKAEKSVDSLGKGDMVKVISVAVIMPVILSLILAFAIDLFGISIAQLEGWFSVLPSFNISAYIIGILVMASICCGIIAYLVYCRIAYSQPAVEVSELRENWQESVHPNEIFINLDNLVMANRRYKEAPNRVYRVLDPELNEQVEGKGGFRGEMIQEVQPKVKKMEFGNLFHPMKLGALIFGNVLFLLASLCTFWLAYSLIDVYHFFKPMPGLSFDSVFNSAKGKEFVDLIMIAFNVFLIGFLCKAFALLLAKSTHIFFAEIQFESLLVYFRCEGTFTESKISTGTSIHDSTRSENTLVRSSITPWVIVSKVVSSTFAATGLKNLEYPRYVLEMHKAPDQLEAIRNDVITFLKDRESIASITSERDLGNASQIHQLNQQTRAMPSSDNLLTHDEEAGGYLRQEEDLAEEEERIDDRNKAPEPA